ncbi:flagellar assembly protein FliX [Devosia albogilva]|uniref:Flagellar assembly protein FliX n=1 Tax=Devosia albogilva TaxID=429726 RepID=A0ABW5QGU7_9HYPH
MRIESTHRSTAAGKSGGAGRSGTSAAFVPAGAEGPARTAPASPSAPVAALDAILALQSVGDPLMAKRRAVRRGHDLLDELDAMKADLLVGRVSPARLDAMLETVTTLRERTEPGLDAVLDEIELRVVVELAKHGRYVAA